MTNDNWIKCSERLPETGENVIVIQDPTTTATRKPLFAVFDGARFFPPVPTIFADFKYGTSAWVDITHWQPLPEPPKMEGEK